MPDAGIGPKLARAADVLTRDMMCIEADEKRPHHHRHGEPIVVGVQAIQDAAYRLGAKVASITLAPPVPFQGGLADEYLPDHVKAATGACDVWIDLCMPYLAGSKAFDDAMEKNRVRYFLGADVGADEMVRLMGGRRPRRAVPARRRVRRPCSRSPPARTAASPTRTAPMSASRWASRRASPSPARRSPAAISCPAR